MDGTSTRVVTRFDGRAQTTLISRQNSCQALENVICSINEGKSCDSVGLTTEIATCTSGANGQVILHRMLGKGPSEDCV